MMQSSANLDIGDPQLVRELLALPAVRAPQDALPAPPRLAYASLFFRAAALVAILAAFNPTTLGKYLWREVPALQRVMHVLMVGAEAEPERARDLVPADSERGEIAALVAAVSAAFREAPDVVARHFATQWMLFFTPPRPLARPLPADFLARLNDLNAQYRLGFRLCLCRSPDYLLELVGSRTSGSGSAVRFFFVCCCSFADRCCRRRTPSPGSATSSSPTRRP